MKKIIIFFLTIVLLGAGCANKISLNDAAEKTLAEPDFCLKQQQDAEKKIGSFKLKESQATVYRAWKEDFIKLNGITEDFFKDHIFLAEIQEPWKTATGAETTHINYYYKLGDVYLYSRGIDSVAVNPDSLDYFKKTSVEDLLKQTGDAKVVSNAPHPSLGKTPAHVFTEYSWGIIEVNNIKDQPSDALSCQDAVLMLRSCRNDIVPGNLAWKPRLGLAWIDGFGGDINSSKEDCAYAAVYLFQKKVESCNLNIRCSRDIGL